MIGVCLKWVESHGAPGDDRYSVLSPADQAALEMALQHGAALGEPVHAVTVGRPAAEQALRLAMACGAGSAGHVMVDDPVPSDAVAAELADELAAARWVWCGDYSLDNGTGSVPAMVAHHLGVAQALGVVHVDIDAHELRCTRRLDGGRREVLRLTSGVVSVEGSVVRLRRAPLGSLLRSADAHVSGRHSAAPAPREAVAVASYRPRARTLPAPEGDTALQRLRLLTDSSSAKSHGEVIEADPADAAAHILDSLRHWGYLPHP
jgi:electron transfer flavoprotein beta subunit